jgi:hypothetical protein
MARAAPRPAPATSGQDVDTTERGSAGLAVAQMLTKQHRAFSFNGKPVEIVSAVAERMFDDTERKKPSVIMRPVRGRILSALRAILAAEGHETRRTRYPRWAVEILGPVAAVSGSKTLLSAWETPSVSIVGAGELGALLARMWTLQEARKDAPKFEGFFASELVRDEPCAEYW